MAQIVSILAERPSRGERFLVDANVWLLILYPRMALARAGLSADYSSFVKRCRDVDAGLFYTSVVLSEIATVVERAEATVMLGQSPIPGELKRLRRDVTSRGVMLQAVFQVIRGVEENAQAIACCEEASAPSLCNLLRGSLLDGNDALLVDAYRRQRLSAILTDDADFATVEKDLIVFTGNRRILS